MYLVVVGAPEQAECEVQLEHFPHLIAIKVFDCIGQKGVQILHDIIENRTTQTLYMGGEREERQWGGRTRRAEKLKSAYVRDKFYTTHTVGMSSSSNNMNTRYIHTCYIHTLYNLFTYNLFTCSSASLRLFIRAKATSCRRGKKPAAESFDHSQYSLNRGRGVVLIGYLYNKWQWC